jgi:hypothetical protein
VAKFNIYTIKAVPLHATTLMMETARTSETSVDIQLRTWQYIPEDSERHTRRRENLKSHKICEPVHSKRE